MTKPSLSTDPQKEKMPTINFSLRKALSRRTFLKGAGVAMALPFMEAMRPGAYATDKSSEQDPLRMVILMNSLSLLPQHFFPEKAGYDYESTPYLDLLKNHRKHMTVMSGVSLPEVASGHGALPCFLTGAPNPGSANFKNSISLDVFAAEKMGQLTRFPFMPIMIAPSNGGAESGEPMSFTTAGVPIPGEKRAEKLFSKMFLQGDKEEVQAQITRLREERSILDMLIERVKKLNPTLSKADREKLEHYMTSVRELEKKLVTAEAWEKKPKPMTDAKMPKDMTTFTNGVEQHKIIFDVMKLALTSDSSRIISLGIHMGSTRQDIQGVEDGTHPLSHHGNDPIKMEQLRIVEELQLKEINLFLNSLAETTEQSGSLLDNTMVLFGSNMGNASSHSNVNLPIFLAGGGFKHGQHLMFDKKNNYPLTNLYVSMLQRMGLEVDKFSSSTGTMEGLEFA
ncbi:MAG: DUF1552 domain-containing protein [Lentisphaerales bacterium]|nr:DUF1552 domain-containing protein [Lentisphaerales bacterium]